MKHKVLSAIVLFSNFSVSLVLCLWAAKRAIFVFCLFIHPSCCYNLFCACCFVVRFVALLLLTISSYGSVSLHWSKKYKTENGKLCHFFHVFFFRNIWKKKRNFDRFFNRWIIIWLIKKKGFKWLDKSAVKNAHQSIASTDHSQLYDHIQKM